MKKILVLLALFIACFNLVFAQGRTNVLDSTIKAYQKNKQDTTLAQVYVLKAGIVFLTTNVDSGMFYSRKALTLSRKINYKKGEVGALAGIATFQQINGDLPGALKTTFEALPEALKIHDARTVASCYNTRGLAYSTMNDRKKSLDNYYSALRVVEASHLLDLKVVELNNIARQYLDINKLDSASYFVHHAYDFAIQNKIATRSGYLIRNFGIIEYKKGNWDSAISFYEKSLADSNAKKDHYLRSEDFRRIAEVYQKKNQPDSCISYAQKSLEEAKLDKNPDQIQRDATLLTDEYKSVNDYKNAFNYEQITLQARDSLFSQQKTLQVQNLVYNERQRQQEARAAEIAYQNKVRFYTLLGVIGVFILFAGILLFANTQRKKANVLLQQQNEQIETQRKDLEKTVADLRTTQKQLIQSEKMASLGELTAGIAHEIQNPLNFINNFSEVNTELIEEMEQEINQGRIGEVSSIAYDIKANQEKISQHGKRADFIVKGMLQHSRASTGEKQLTNLNVLADEFFKLSFHGLRAKDKSFNAEMATNFDDRLPKVNIVQQDVGRVLLNLFNNAFYAVNKKAKTAGKEYKPTVEISTSTREGWVQVSVKDNGTGIPDSVKDKIMQPFFTTKPTGEGTGLGLSLSYDIVVKGHGGSIDVNTKEGEFTEFTVTLPS